MWDKLRAKFMGKQETRVLVVGLDGAGKSTIVQRLKYGQTMDDSEVIPTIGFNIECVEYKKMIFSLWDLGGSQDARAFWRFYYQDTQAVIFVVDSSDNERMVRNARCQSAVIHSVPCSVFWLTRCYLRAGRGSRRAGARS